LVPEFGKAFEDFVRSHTNPPQGLKAMSDGVFSILGQMIRFGHFHKYVSTYLNLEESLRQQGQSKLSYDVGKLKSELAVIKPLFEAQYSIEEKSKLKAQDIPGALLTATEGRIVRLKDYLFHTGPSAQIRSATLLNHKGQKVDWS
jgi:hypothetical protein